ncbi:MAG: helix-turn-helix domain-containing protein [Oscillospiraceae bacterium]|nr:helix-turn-helix domain-containing protein [Oscillospiraceae bacterium]MCR4761130.1 helix-turn-helix domain-containing protein [Oscillospiraceae bacterium]
MKLQILVADSGTHTTAHLDHLFSVLEETEYTISQHTTNLNDAVRLVLSQKFDILLCINRAPEYIAAKLLRLTGTSENRIPAIIISEQDDSQRMRECFLLGAIDFLAEPIPPEDLLAAVSRAAALVHEQLIETEYRTAVSHALDTLPDSEELQPVSEKLRAFLLKMEHQTATVELAADYFGFNRDYFGRYFKNKFGMTFGEFYKGFQINYAERLLESGQFKVLEVSRLLGFSTPDYFTRVFKKHTGVVPSEIKK